MAAVHFGRMQGSARFSRTVAVKQLHPQFAQDPDFITMFLDEARIAARIQHPNVVAPLDVVVLDDDGEALLVMEYVQGETLGRLMRAAPGRSAPVPPPIAAAILTGALHGLHAAHEARDEAGAPLGVVHRDISPQNILVGVDGIARVLDFGIAKAVSRSQVTRDGHFKGKLAYMSPEQVRAEAVDRRADIFAAGVVYWEALSGSRLFEADDPAGTVAQVLEKPIPPPSRVNPAVDAVTDGLVMQALERNADRRFQTASDFAAAIEERIAAASPRQVGEWVARTGAKALAQRAAIVARIESADVEPITPPTTAGLPLPAPAVPSPIARRANSSSNIGSLGGGELIHGPGARRSGRRWTTPVVALALVAGALVAVIGLGRRWISVDAETPGALPADPATAAASVREVVRPRIEPQPEPAPPENGAPATSEAPDRDPPAAEEAPSPPRTKRARSHRTQPAKTKRRPAAAAAREREPAAPAAAAAPAPARPAHDCTPPYTVDAKGIRRVKPQCL